MSRGSVRRSSVGMFAAGLVWLSASAVLGAPLPAIRASSEAPKAAVPAGVSALAPSLTVVPSALSCAGGGALPPGPADGWSTPIAAPATEPPDYYAIELVPTGRVPGTRQSKGLAYSTAATSPFFGVSLAPSGEYLHDLDIRVEGLKPPPRGAYVAWVTDTEVENVVRLGALDENLRASGTVAWNKFLVVVTREPTSQATEKWEGPIIMRGMSRSGRMHTLAGHGPFQAEPCAKYGFK